ncbi:transposase [Roseateles sp. DXS20W]|uniref:transposase n=1 Tax=Pelomonas lactea TaxID=3299030 RepID=UPI00374865E2
MQTLLWSCGSAGIPALTLREMVGTVSYNTAFSLTARLREGLVRGQNTGLIAGVVEIDGAHASGHDAAGKRGRPLRQQQPKTVEEADAKAKAIVDAFNAKQAKRNLSAEQKKAAKTEQVELRDQGAVRDPNTGQVLPLNRRMVITLRRRSGNPGDGSVWTKVGVGMAETPEVVEHLATRHVLIPESVLATDEGVAFKKLGKQFRLHQTVNHGETLVGPDGEHNNLAESFTARQDRAEAGIYLNVEPKYLMDYACETAFREDHRRVPAPVRTAKLLFWALNVGRSHYWRGYTHGKNRKHELLVPEQLPVGSSSGPAPREPGSEMDGRPPR